MGIGELWNLILINPMTNVLVALAELFGGNFGISIIIFTLVMRFITWPLTASQYKQSKKMQELQPRMQELQKKYKGKDPKKLQQETMALYKEAGVNPIGCIFPMLVQFPIWIALYQVINRTLGETPESFVGLSQVLYPIPFIHQAIPLNNVFLIWNLGKPDPTFILPVLVAVTMYVQQKLVTPAPNPNATPQQLQQQQTMQMMTWMMPLMFGWFTLTVPAGLGLYWAVSNISGVVFQYFYMGRRVEWKSLLSFGPPKAPAPVPAIKGADAPSKQQKGKGGDSSPATTANASREALPQDNAAEYSVSEGGEAALPPPQSGRRKKHGRRRGKR
jgi:YidC/Oxa1 family membrane protein insertase